MKTRIKLFYIDFSVQNIFHFTMLAVIMIIDICFGTLRSYIHVIRCLCCGVDQEYVLSRGWEQTVQIRVCGGTSILDTRPLGAHPSIQGKLLALYIMMHYTYIYIKITRQLFVIWTL